MPDIPAAINDWLDIIANQSPRQATMMVPAQMLEQFNALPLAQREEILADIDAIAASYGLGTPVKIIPIAE